MSWFSWFRKKKEPAKKKKEPAVEAAEVGLKGGEVLVNPPAKQLLARKEARLERVKWLLANTFTEQGHPKRESLMKTKGRLQHEIKYIKGEF